LQMSANTRVNAKMHSNTIGPTIVLTYPPWNYA